MKTIRNLLSIILASFLLMPGVPVFAAERMSLEDAEELVDQMFDDMEGSEKVLEMPDGGFLYGEAYIAPAEDITEVLISYDSETDPDSKTVEETKIDLIDDLVNGTPTIQPRGASVPTQNYVLGPGAVYKSSPFSGAGWRFSGYMFAPRPDTGYYLLWTSYGDDARVGDIVQARNTLNGTIQGEIIYNGVSKYINKATLSHVYYTYNPVDGSYYVVANY
ncbi:hypothetical protein [uncultured Faecalicoccus sp.]|uniref:hypothetical protein n=1 Tax=uncultured Faecalicoccus sp. TaxID=1971760 RepID=UPI0025F5CAB1|nr:hypothetical protein [uncultured Faecalicoccus sp.]